MSVEHTAKTGPTLATVKVNLSSCAKLVGLVNTVW